MAELYLQELRYQLGEDPGPWIEKMQRVQVEYGYDDAQMVLLAELCMKKPATEFVHQFSRSSIQDVYAGFLRLYELCKRVDTEKAFKWAMLHVRCKGSHNPKNALPGVKRESLSSSSPAEEISVTGDDDMLRFPEYSFKISCEFGDICINDVLKFDQTLVYKKASLQKGTVCKPYKRTVVGRVAHKADGVEVTSAVRNDSLRMSENFSQSDEEPTYTIEVYWSRGVKPAPTSEPFIIKAHSLKLLNPVRQVDVQKIVQNSSSESSRKAVVATLGSSIHTPPPSRFMELCSVHTTHRPDKFTAPKTPKKLLLKNNMQIRKQNQHILSILDGNKLERIYIQNSHWTQIGL